METGMRIPLLPLIAAILMLFPLTTLSQRAELPPPRPLCASQYTLVNYACARLPYTPGAPPSPPSPPPSPPSPPSPDDDSSNHHGHRHHHHGHRQREHQETAVEAECCRWLKQMDPECVCDLLVHLPPFLARPVHNYTVVVDESCSVTYSCGGRIIVR